ncbi:hypothetical protein BT63DRAFT_454785 [Microthyrium microscopicum]|uniref:Uncharacterized protein n=1 Tax=Microthyrium microscopicum TaxID=703497 RepID=A0A6A6UE38_9PEZI|nr:hypothetical protein BT63DRAFT_454785 [Microthyrium microscopicum]
MAPKKRTSISANSTPSVKKRLSASANGTQSAKKRQSTFNIVLSTVKTRAQIKQKLATFPFMYLPGELRNMIYHEALDFNSLCKPHGKGKLRAHPLLLLNKQVSGEAKEILKRVPLIMEQLPPKGWKLEKNGMSSDLLANLPEVELHFVWVTPDHYSIARNESEDQYDRLITLLTQLVKVWTEHEHKLKKFKLTVSSDYHELHLNSCPAVSSPGPFGCYVYSQIRQALLALKSLRGIQSVEIGGLFDTITEKAEIIEGMKGRKGFSLQELAQVFSGPKEHRVKGQILRKIMEYASYRKNPFEMQIELDNTIWNLATPAELASLANLHNNSGADHSLLHKFLKPYQEVRQRDMSTPGVLTVSRWMSQQIREIPKSPMVINKPFLPAMLLDKITPANPFSESAGAPWRTLSPFMMDTHVTHLKGIVFEYHLGYGHRNHLWKPLIAAFANILDHHEHMMQVVTIRLVDDNTPPTERTPEEDQRIVNVFLPIKRVTRPQGLKLEGVFTAEQRMQLSSLRRSARHENDVD